MDFAIEYKDKVIMIEVKSKDAYYEPEKTQELLNAYKIYMKKYSDKKLHLVLYMYDKNNKSQGLSLMIGSQWKDNISFFDALENLLK